MVNKYVWGWIEYQAGRSLSKIESIAYTDYLTPDLWVYINYVLWVVVACIMDLAYRILYCRICVPCPLGHPHPRTSFHPIFPSLFDVVSRSSEFLSIRCLGNSIPFALHYCSSPQMVVDLFRPELPLHPTHLAHPLTSLTPVPSPKPLSLHPLFPWCHFVRLA